MNRRFTFIVAIMGGFFIAAGAFQVWSAVTAGNPFTVPGILIFIVGWVLGWAGIFELVNLVRRHRNEELDAIEPDRPVEDEDRI